MNVEIEHLTKLLIGFTIGEGQFIRILYPGVLNKFGDLYQPPTCELDSISRHKNVKIIEKYTQIDATGSVLVLVFRTAKPISFSWNPTTLELRRFDDKMMDFEDWIRLHLEIHKSRDFEAATQLIRKDYADFLKPTLKNLRSLIGVKLAVDRVERIMLLLLHVDEEVVVEEAKEVLKFIYLCDRNCDKNPRLFPWYSEASKMEAEIENDAERDKFVEWFTQAYNSVKIASISNLLISCGTDLWDHYGYKYPSFFTECGTPVQSRYKLFLSYIEIKSKSEAALKSKSESSTK